MLTPTQRGIAANLSHLQTLGPDDRVQLHNVLEPDNGSHRYAPMSVSPGQMAALKAANDAIDDTWQILNHGSGNQCGHVESSQGESYKRTTLSYELLNLMNTGFTDPNYHKAFVAASVQAGNCDQMADVNALLLSTSGFHGRVSLMAAKDVGHAFVAVGDNRERGQIVISDAWPEFGRALRAEEFALAGQHPQVVRHYDVGYRPEVHEALFNASKFSQQEIDGYFAQVDPVHGYLDKNSLAPALLSNPNIKFYKQEHGSKNLGAAYHDSSGSSPVIDQSLSMRQFNERLVKSSHPPIVQSLPSQNYSDEDMPDLDLASLSREIDMYCDDSPGGSDSDR